MKVNTIQQVLNSVPKRLAVGLIVTAIAVTPLSLFAWGPSDRSTYTMEVPANKVAFNSITDNPDVGDERNFVRVSTGTAGWSDVATMTEGQSYFARIYVHNNAAANLNLVARNVRASLNLPTKENTWGKQFEVNGFVKSSNAQPNEVWDNIVLKSDRDFHVKVEYAKYYNNNRTEETSGWDLNQSELFSSNGAQLGYTSMDGNIPGCLKYSGYVLVKFSPVFKQTPPAEKTPGYDVIKTVDKTSAKPGDTINYTLVVKNTGKVDLTNVKITDRLPEMYSKVNEQVNAPSKTTGSISKDGLITIAKLPVGSTATIKISYTIKNAEQLDCGDTKIVNKVTGTTDQDQTEDNNSNNEVTTTVNKQCQPGNPGNPNTPETPSTIAETGAGATIAGIIGMGTLIGVIVAYLRSRKLA